ncbi:MAG TPA: prepilin peptidase [Actinomycetota bacterium]|nr:prepilin peptidase [Actinomycetota bacterium]
MTAAEIVLAFIGGLAFGSFANVVAFRVPNGYSIVAPRSACPHCEKPIAWYDNIPLVSYAVLGAKCRRCHQHISIRYPLIELGNGVLWALIVGRLGVHPELPAYLAFATALVTLSAIDIGHHRLPNKVLGPSFIIGAVLLVGATLVHHRWSNLEHAAIGAVAYGLPMLVLGIAAPSAMGGGDIKFAPYLGFHLGWFGLSLVLGGALLGLLAGGLGAALLLAVGRKGMKDAIPFGPFMALGAMAMLLLGAGALKPWLG